MSARVGAPRIRKVTRRQPYESRGTPLSVDEVLGILEDVPRQLAALTKDLPATRLNATPILGVWSMNDVLAHLRSVNEARGEFIRAMLDTPRPTLRAIDPRALQRRGDYRGHFAPSFRAFRTRRASLLRYLKALPRRSWSRTAIITGGGPPRERTVLYYARWVAGHERAHVRHIERAVAAVSTSPRDPRPRRRPSAVARGRVRRSPA